MDNNIPLGLSQQYDSATNSTTLTWSYLESANINSFEVQYYDEDLRKWVAFDGRSGIIKKK
jgi:hypothetical protein